MHGRARGEEGLSVKIFSFLKNHKINLVIALVLLFVQANCELTLPTLMSDIVDTGITGGGIDSAVPDTITKSRFDEVKLFLTDDESAKVDAAYTERDGNLVFDGSADDRETLEGFMGEAEVMAYQFDQGIDTKDLKQQMGLGDSGASTGAESDASSAAALAQAQAGTTSQLTPEQLAALSQLASKDKLTTGDLKTLVDAGIVSRDQLVDAREQMIEKLGATGDQIVTQRAIAFVKEAYKDAGIDLDKVQTDYLFAEGAKMLGFAALGAACAILAAFNASRTAATIARDLRHDMYQRVLSFSPREMNQFSAASLITRGTNDIQQIQMVLVMCMRMVLFAPCMGLGAVWRVISYGDTGLQWVVVAAVCLIAIVIGVLMGLTMPRFRKMQTLVDKNNLVAREILTGIMPIRAFGRTGYEEKRYDAANKELTGTYIFTNRAMAFMMPMMLIVMNVTSVAIVWFGGLGVDAGTMQVGDLMAYMNYTIQVIMSFMVITMISVMLPRADVAAGRVQEVLATYSSIEDPASSGEGAAAKAPAGGWKGELAFHDVSFTYPDSDTPTLEHVDFDVRPGTTLGIIGSTGVGKSTLVQLIPRLYDATEGSVTVDGVDVRAMGLEELRGLIGYVPQKGMLFSGDIESNIKYGDPSMPDADMERAAETAQAAEFIETKDERYASAIAQGGSNVSGGQRQRLAIARALAISPKILVFDDSFSALDYKTDSKLRAALAERERDASVVIVAQRIATIMHAEQIIVLDDGRVVGKGTHEKLLRDCPEYLEIATSQLSARELGLTEDPGHATSSPVDAAKVAGDAGCGISAASDGRSVQGYVSPAEGDEMPCTAATEGGDL